MALKKKKKVKKLFHWEYIEDERQGVYSGKKKEQTLPRKLLFKNYKTRNIIVKVW